MDTRVRLYDTTLRDGTQAEGVSFSQADKIRIVERLDVFGIEGIAARLAFSGTCGMFSMVWDEAVTVDLPEQLAKAVANTSTPTWPHTWVVPKYATMGEYKQYAPANHFHMTWGLKPARLQYWMDLANVLSVTPWQQRPAYIEGVDRPQPLLYLLNGGEANAKLLRARG